MGLRLAFVSRFCISLLNLVSGSRFWGMRQIDDGVIVDERSERHRVGWLGLLGLLGWLGLLGLLGWLYRFGWCNKSNP